MCFNFSGYFERFMTNAKNDNFQKIWEGLVLCPTMKRGQTSIEIKIHANEGETGGGGSEIAINL